MAHVELQSRREGAALYLKPMAKELSYENSEDFRKAIEDVIAVSKGVDRFLVDLTDVEYLFSAGIGLLTYLLRISKDREIRNPTIVGAQPFVLETLEVVGMEKTFEFFPDLTLALST